MAYQLVHSIMNEIARVHGPDYSKVDERTGQCALHRLADTFPVVIDRDIGKFELRNGIENVVFLLRMQLDCQDNQGKTPLHLAVARGSLNVTDALLTLGADINVADYEGLTPFNYSDQTNEQSSISSCLRSHVYKLLFLNLEVSKANSSEYEKIRQRFDGNSALFICYSETKLKSIQICEGYSLRDFLTETAVANYVTMPKWKREAIEQFVCSKPDQDSEGNWLDQVIEDNWRMNMFADLVNLQLRKAKKRMSLMELAKCGVTLLAHRELPDPCSEAIIRYLTNTELRVLISIWKAAQAELDATADAGSGESVGCSSKRRKLGD